MRAVFPGKRDNAMGYLREIVFVGSFADCLGRRVGDGVMASLCGVGRELAKLR